MLIAALREHGFDAHDLGIVSDDEETLANVLREARRFDLVVTSGGVSMGQCQVLVVIGGCPVVNVFCAATNSTQSPSSSCSSGEKDLLKETLLSLNGTMHFGRVLMKPGKPTTLFEVPREDNAGGNMLFFALPGNRTGKPETKCLGPSHLPFCLLWRPMSLLSGSTLQ
jgi:gephyrin